MSAKNAPLYSEIAIAEDVARKHATTWRFCENGPGWLCWDGVRWVGDQSAVQVHDAVREAVKRAAAALKDDDAADSNPESRTRQARRLAASPTVQGVQRMLRGMSALSITVDALDADPLKLNTPAGIVDLMSGKMLPHAPAALQTKLTSYSPEGAAPRWSRFLVETFGEDPALLAYVQRMAGYFLTGETREQTFWFALGGGGNGKSVFFDTLRAVMGSYARVAPAETFMATTSAQHPADVAALVGARLVLANETEDGARLAESRIKQLTGGDRVTARLMRQNFFEFTPQFKLVIIGNHLPALRNVDDAMRRRLHVLPFTRKPAVPDRNLPQALASEGNGILKWAVDGLVAYRRDGLAPPPVVLAATDMYFEDEDVVSQWLKEHYERAAGFTETIGTSELHLCWRNWCEQNGASPGTIKWLSSALIARGFIKSQHPRNRRWGFSGLFRRNG
ncbi:phage/plasmid primase, P4 family [Nevskia sp.]|uniref:phage/plasmid primase, P4 family n=1 Tax=Nevskia sp. TaxID=1929292 RepID=UPI0025E907AB|nr:phage/plasmid primase, P4 family [Nevskia sp.]